MRMFEDKTPLLSLLTRATPRLSRVWCVIGQRPVTNDAELRVTLHTYESMLNVLHSYLSFSFPISNEV